MLNIGFAKFARTVFWCPTPEFSVEFHNRIRFLTSDGILFQVLGGMGFKFSLISE